MKIELIDLAVPGIQIVQRPNAAPYWIITDQKAVDDAFKMNGAPVYYFPVVYSVIESGGTLSFGKLTILESELKGNIYQPVPIRALRADERIVKLQSGDIAVVRDETSTLDEIGSVADELRSQRRILEAIAVKVGAEV